MSRNQSVMEIPMQEQTDEPPLHLFVFMTMRGH